MTGDAEQRIRKYCSYQERCSSEVTAKLTEYGVRGEKAMQLLRNLKKEGFVDDARFARIFAGSKFRRNRWGRVRIFRELTARGIPGQLITQGLREIPEEEYRHVLEEILIKKSKEIPKEKKLTARNKLFNFAVRKGFEESLVLESLNKMKTESW